MSSILTPAAPTTRAAAARPQPRQQYLELRASVHRKLLNRLNLEALASAERSRAEAEIRTLGMTRARSQVMERKDAVTCRDSATGTRGGCQITNDGVFLNLGDAKLLPDGGFSVFVVLEWNGERTGEGWGRLAIVKRVESRWSVQFVGPVRAM